VPPAPTRTPSSSRSATSPWPATIPTPPRSRSAAGTGLEILGIDADKVVVRLANTSTYDFDANGEYSAMRCS
jgi:hypothetical protein